MIWLKYEKPITVNTIQKRDFYFNLLFLPALCHKITY